MIKDPILIVDDDDNLRETMAEALAPLPVEITTADSGQAALNEIEKRSFAVVVTDLVMKDRDGFAVLQQAKRRHQAGRVMRFWARCAGVHSYQSATAPSTPRKSALKSVLMPTSLRYSARAGMNSVVWPSASITG